MKSKLIAPLLVASFVSIATPAFASGFGPAPSYNPKVGAPASQRGPSVLVVRTRFVDAGANAYGGIAAVNAESGSRAGANSNATVFGHR